MTIRDDLTAEKAALTTRLAAIEAELAKAEGWLEAEWTTVEAWVKAKYESLLPAKASPLPASPPPV